MSRKLWLNLSELDSKHTTKVVDDYNDYKYLITGRWGVSQDNFSVYSVSNALLAEVNQIGRSSMPKFTLHYLNRFVGTSIVNINLHYLTIYIGGLNWLITGNLNKQKFTIRKGTKIIATINSHLKNGDIIREVWISEMNLEPLLITIAAVIKHPQIPKDDIKQLLLFPSK